MNEKVKKYLVVLVYRTAFVIGIFLLLFITDRAAPQVMEKISVIWTKNIDFQRMGELFSEFKKELLSF